MSGSALIKVVGVAAAIVVAIAVTLLFDKGESKADGPKVPEVGECLNLDGPGGDATPEPIACSDPAATYAVVADDGRCDDDAERDLTIAREASGADGAANLCLALNAEEGDCFIPGEAQDAKVDCAETAGDVEVNKVVGVGTSGDGCDDAVVFDNATRGIRLCLAPNS